MSCYCCDSENYKSITGDKTKTHYRQCLNCKSIYIPGNLVNGLKFRTENDAPDKRNADTQNATRIERIRRELKDLELKSVLDVGYGNGEFMAACSMLGIKTYGYDNLGYYKSKIPNEVQAVNMTEVIEHVKFPRLLFLTALNVLQPNGIIYIETTFADNIESPTTNPYVDNEIGHINIVSKKGLSSLLPKELVIESYLNENVAIIRRTA